MKDPDFTTDNPVMQYMYAGFLQWIFGEESAHEAFTDATGMVRPRPPMNAMEAAVDKATGYDFKAAGQEYVARFVEWVTENYWNGEPPDDTDKERTE